MQISSFVSTGRDVTDRIRLEEKRAQLLEILEATTDFVAIMDDEGRLRYLNRAGRTMLGLPADTDISGRYIADCHPDWATQRILMEAFPTALREGAWHGENVVMGADGREIAVSPVVLAHGGSDGAAGFFSTIARDISARKHFARALKRQAARGARAGL